MLTFVQKSYSRFLIAESEFQLIFTGESLVLSLSGRHVMIHKISPKGWTFWHSFVALAWHDIL